jgi:hypothetical protein
MPHTLCTTHGSLARPCLSQPWIIHKPVIPSKYVSDTTQSIRPVRVRASTESGGFASNIRKTFDRALVSIADKLEEQLSLTDIPLSQQMAVQLEESQQLLLSGMRTAFGAGDPSLEFMQAYYELQTIYHNYTVQANAKNPISSISLTLDPAEFLPDVLHIITLFSQAKGPTSLVDLAAKQLGPQDSAVEQYIKAVVVATLQAGSSVTLPAVPIAADALASAGTTVAKITSSLAEAYSESADTKSSLDALHWHLYSSLHLGDVSSAHHTCYLCDASCLHFCCGACFEISSDWPASMHDADAPTQLCCSEVVLHYRTI